MRSLLLTITGVAHLLFGTLFLCLSGTATRLLVVDPPPRSVLLVRGLGGILLAFGTINLLARNSTDRTALRAIVAGTFLYLFITVAFDVRWALAGLLQPAAWATIAIRAVLALAYAHALWRMRG